MITHDFVHTPQLQPGMYSSDCISSLSPSTNKITINCWWFSMTHARQNLPWWPKAKAFTIIHKACMDTFMLNQWTRQIMLATITCHGPSQGLIRCASTSLQHIMLSVLGHTFLHPFRQKSQIWVLHKCVLTRHKLCSCTWIKKKFGYSQITHVGINLDFGQNRPQQTNRLSFINPTMINDGLMQENS